MSGKIAFQGLPGAYSDMACRAVYPSKETLPCPGTTHNSFSPDMEGEVIEDSVRDDHASHVASSSVPYRCIQMLKNIGTTGRNAKVSKSQLDL